MTQPSKIPLAQDGSVSGAQAIRRAMDVVRAVAQLQRRGATLKHVAKATGLNTSTAFRILRSLTEERMFRYDEQTRTYELGLLAFELGVATTGRSHVQERWNDTIEHIARRTRLTTYLMARSENEAVCLLCVQGSTMIRAMPIDVGQRLPLGIGAGSLAILSTLDDEEIARILAAQQDRLALYPQGLDIVPRILERVEETRSNGFSFSAGSVAPGLGGVGVPVLPQPGLLQLAVSVSAVSEISIRSEARQIAEIIATAIRARLETYDA